ncbi:MAG TPA: hypothetical protein VE571_13540 [Solirubrobacteraceae bacterium]|jgi:hypothetical protein|nr:hypothetical protein [Solirubrobacteraceae bacterium]
MRLVLLVVVLVFITLIVVATASDIARHHHVSGLDVLSIIVVVLFATGIVGALTQRPRQ